MPARPLFNIASVLAPCLILAWAWLAARGGYPQGAGAAGAMAAGVLLVLGAAVGAGIGFVLAMIALFRGERWIGVSIGGLLLSLALALWVVSVFQRPGSPPE